MTLKMIKCKDIFIHFHARPFICALYNFPIKTAVAFYFFLLPLELRFEEPSLSWSVSMLCAFHPNTHHTSLYLLWPPFPPVTCVYLCIFLITCFSCSGAAICRIPCKVKKMPLLRPELGLRRRGPSGQRLRASSSTMGGTKEKEATGLKMGWDGNPKAAVTGWVSALVCGL